MLTIRGLSKSYGPHRALDGADLSVAAGEVVALLGPNGAGKTTLVSCVAGLLRPDAGSVVVAGVDATRSPQRARRLVGLAPQELGLYPSLSVRDNLRLFGELAGVRGKTLRARTDEVAEALDLTELLPRWAGELSGGQQRRVHTAMALVHRPPLLLLDEPTVGADVETRGHLLAAVRALADDGAAVCYTTHYLPEVEALAARVVVLVAGRVVTSGSVDDLVGSYTESSVEFVFDGPAPDLAGTHPVPDRPHVRRISSTDPGRDAARVMASLPPDAPGLRSLEVVRPGLEAAYLALAGARPTEVADVA